MYGIDQNVWSQRKTPMLASCAVHVVIVGWAIATGPQLPTKEYHACSYPFSQKKVIFFEWEARIREIKKKESFFRHESAKCLKRVKFFMHLYPFVSSAYLNSYASKCIWAVTMHIALEVMKNTTRIEKCLEFNTVILTFTKMALYLIQGKKRVWLKKGCFIEWFRLIKECFCPKSGKRGVFQTWVQGWDTLWSWVGEGHNVRLF